MTRATNDDKRGSPVFRFIYLNGKPDQIYGEKK